MRSEFDAEDLRAFGMIAASGGLSAAARNFSRSKATLSRSLARLEAAAGSPLFDRVAKGLRLTPAGELLSAAAATTVDATRDAEEILRRADGVPSGPLRIACSALTGQVLVAPVLGKLIRDYPAIEPSLQVSSQGPDPLGDDLDVVVRVGRPPEPYLIARRIVAGELHLYVPASVGTMCDIHDPEAVEDLGRVVMDVSSIARTWILRRNEQTIEMSKRPLIAVGDPTVAVAFLRSSKGVTFLPDLFGDAFVESGELVKALPDWSGPAIELYASLPPKRALVPAVRAFLDLLVRETKLHTPTAAVSSR